MRENGGFVQLMRAHAAQYKHAVGYIDLMLCGRGPAQVSHCGVSGINSSSWTVYIVWSARVAIK